MPQIIPFIPLITSGLGFAGGLLKNKSGQTQTTTPTLDPAYNPLQTRLLQMVQQRLGASQDMSGYQAGGQQNINRTFDTIGQSQANNLSARGLSTSPVAGAVDATRENARAGQTASFLNTIPLLQRQMQSEDLGLASSILGQGRGSTMTSTGQSGGGLAGGVENLAQMLGYYTANGAFGRRPPIMNWGTTYANPTDVQGMG